MEPKSEEIKAKIEWCKQQRSKDPPEVTIPSTIEEEKRINPFMRVTESIVQEHAKTQGDPVATMKAIRSEKDDFKA